MTKKSFLVLLAFLFAVTGLVAAEDGRSLYMSQKFKCYQCHGEKGEGAMGPSFQGIGKKYKTDELMKRAAHNCPPTGACDPKQLRAIVEYLRTL